MSKYLIRASEPPTDAEIDELCRAMWGDATWWFDPASDETLGRSPRVQCRDLDRARMRKFLDHLS